MECVFPFVDRLHLNSEEFTVWKRVQIAGQILKVVIGFVGHITAVATYSKSSNKISMKLGYMQRP